MVNPAGHSPKATPNSEAQTPLLRRGIRALGSMVSFSPQKALADWAAHAQDPRGLNFIRFEARFGRSADQVIESCPKDLEKVLRDLCRYPATSHLIRQLGKEGGIQFKLGHRKYGSTWSPHSRTITIDYSLLRKSRKADLLHAIVFELHNASQSRELAMTQDRLAEGFGHRTQGAYADAIEGFEYKSCWRAADLIDNAIASSIFAHYDLTPRRSWTCNVETYRIMQEFYGHTQYYHRQFSQLSPIPPDPNYKGRLPEGWTEEDKQALLAGVVSAVWDLKHERKSDKVEEAREVLKVAVQERIDLLDDSDTKAAEAAQRQLDFLGKVLSDAEQVDVGLRVLAASPDPDEISA